MDSLLFLVPIALGLGLVGLVSFLWTLRDGQYDDLDGASERIFLDEDDRPLPASRTAETAAVNEFKKAHA
jgi:cbb3-type cytochrome oxidase maturation protein